MARAEELFLVNGHVFVTKASHVVILQLSWISAVVNINILERDGLRQAELCPGNTMMNENMIDVLTEICHRIWRTGDWHTPWTQSLIITLTKKATCSSVRSISLISHSSKLVLRAESHLE